jgi:hypothetical protein
MTFTEADVERIVVEVIRRLRAMESPVNRRDNATPVGHDLVLTERVITMRTIDGRLSGVQRLLVPPKSVVTPAARDELKKHKIELVR